MRKQRGRNLFTKAAIRRAIDAARESGVDRIEVELPGQSRIVFTGIASKQGEREAPYGNELDEWMEKKKNAREV